MANNRTAKRVLEEAAILDFIAGYLEKHGGTDALDQDFHDQFTQRFGGRQKDVNWGAATNAKAMRWLKYFYDEGTLDRGRIGLGINWQPGFPKWVYVYTLSNMAKRVREIERR